MALERGAAHQLLDVAGLAAAVALYFDQPELQRAAGRAAHTLVTDNRGALERTLEHVERTLLARGWAEVGAGRVDAAVTIVSDRS